MDWWVRVNLPSVLIRSLACVVLQPSLHPPLVSLLQDIRSEPHLQPPFGLRFLRWRLSGPSCVFTQWLLVWCRMPAGRRGRDRTQLYLLLLFLSVLQTHGYILIPPDCKHYPFQTLNRFQKQSCITCSCSVLAVVPLTAINKHHPGVVSQVLIHNYVFGGLYFTHRYFVRIHSDKCTTQLYFTSEF